MVLFSVRSLFLQVSKTWVTDCTSLHSLHKGSFVLVFLKLLSWLSSVQLASIRILVNILLTLAERNWLRYGFVSYRSCCHGRYISQKSMGPLPGPQVT